MATKVDSYANEANVVIKPEAYIKMLKHVLLYGNVNSQSSVEVMGICYGKKEGNELVQYDSVPISHGSSIEVQFDTQDYAAFATADEQMAEKDYFAIGWYHSHPGLKAFFSKVDVRNHLGWQTDHNPDAFGIVFDHTYFDLGEADKMLGFQAFRLDDYKKGMESDYHDITSKITVEEPDDTAYYKEISALIEAIQAKEPIIKEAKEEMDGGLGVWEEEEEIDDAVQVETVDAITEIKESVTKGISSFSNILMNPILDELNKFTSETENAIIKGPAIMEQTLQDMNAAIGAGLSRIKGYFEEALEKEIDNVSASIEDVIREFSLKQMEVPKKLQNFTGVLSEQLGGIIDEQLSLSLRDFLGKLRNVANTADNLSESQKGFGTSINSQAAMVDNFPTLVETETNNLDKTINALPNKINDLLSKRTNSLKMSLDDIKQTNSDLKESIEELTKIVMSKRK